ncbi:hypothetical protein RSSM_04359 [Rhodopirellula sallentina SM41]|uniref:Uncharacterized protein n=1 Tax=Rhodopirellula sallentina SM41 TaxID=1263870 RepID=M5TYC9_9BACT|nr:hypothetical protein RSSM_04359 [Rhodopirellula sallentina SM41]
MNRINGISAISLNPEKIRKVQKICVQRQRGLAHRSDQSTGLI